MLPYHSSIELKEEHSRSYSDVAATFANSKSHTWNSIALNRERTDIAAQCHEVQGLYHSKDERSASQESTRQAAPKLPGIQSLLNPLEAEGSSGSTISHVPTLQSARSFPRHQLGLEPAQSQPQNYERAAATKPASPQLAFQSDSPGTQHSAYGQARHTESNTTPSTAFASQLQPFLSNSFPPSGPLSTTSQAASDTEGQCPTIILETENGPLQVPIDMQAGSKVADEKRKRNATASHRFRQRRQEKERETSHNISKLEQQIRETTEEIDFYRSERDYFRDIATHAPGGAQLLPRPLSPWQKRQISLCGLTGYCDAQSQDYESGGRDTRRLTDTYAPPQGALMPSEFKR